MLAKITNNQATYSYSHIHILIFSFSPCCCLSGTNNGVCCMCSPLDDYRNGIGTGGSGSVLSPSSPPGLIIATDNSESKLSPPPPPGTLLCAPGAPLPPPGAQYRIGSPSPHQHMMATAYNGMDLYGLQAGIHPTNLGTHPAPEDLPPPTYDPAEGASSSPPPPPPPPGGMIYNHPPEYISL